LFAQSLLNLKVNAPRLNKIVKGVIVYRVIVFMACFFINKAWFNFKIIECIPLSVAFYAGCYTWFKGYKPARFFCNRLQLFTYRVYHPYLYRFKYMVAAGNRVLLLQP